MQRLKDKIAIVTGSSSGIGKAIALRFAQEGATVVVAARRLRKCEETVEQIEAAGGRAVALQTDVAVESEVEELIAETVRRYRRVDILVNNAGALWWYPVSDTPAKKFDLVMEVNVRAAFVLSHLVAAAMIKQKSGHIVNMSPPLDMSVLPGRVAYMISKFGMTMLSQGMDAELQGQGIAVNALWPRTIIESQASINFGLGDRSLWRKADIMADAVYEIVKHHPSKYHGQALIDEAVLRDGGMNDFSQYACVPGAEPMELTWNMEAGKSPR